MAQEEKEGKQQHQKEILEIKEESKDLIWKYMRKKQPQKKADDATKENEQELNEAGRAGESDSNILQKYLKSNWLMKRIRIQDEDIGQHGSESESEEDEQLSSRAFKMISKMLIYENLAFCR